MAGSRSNSPIWLTTSRPTPASWATRPTTAGDACSGLFAPAGNRKMHDQHVRALRELDKIWIGSCLIGTEYDRHIPGMHAIGQSRHVAVRYPLRGHGQSVSIQHGRRLRARHIDDVDVERHASASGALLGTQCGAEHLKGASLLVKEATQERLEVGRSGAAGRTDHRQSLLRIMRLNQRNAGRSDT